MIATVYHYAPWARLPEIMSAGHLRPLAGLGAAVPLLWFSAHPFWEATAGKALADSSGRIVVSMMTMREQAGRFGCIRFALSAADPRLMNWKEACAADGTPRDMRRNMERVGRKRGANPAHWFAVAGVVPLAELDFEVFGAGAWRRALPEEMAQVWREHSAPSVDLSPPQALAA